MIIARAEYGGPFSEFILFIINEFIMIKTVMILSAF